MQNQELDVKVAALEAQLRSFRTKNRIEHALVLVFLLIGFVVLRSMGTGLLGASSAGNADSITASEINLVDANGETVIRMSGPNGYVIVQASEGKPSVVLGIDNNGSGRLSIADPESNLIAALGLNEAGGGALDIFDHDAERSIALTTDKNGSGQLSIGSGDRKAVVLGVDDARRGWLNIYEMGSDVVEGTDADLPEAIAAHNTASNKLKSSDKILIDLAGTGDSVFNRPAIRTWAIGRNYLSFPTVWIGICQPEKLIDLDEDGILDYNIGKAQGFMRTYDLLGDPVSAFPFSNVPVKYPYSSGL